MFSQSGYQALPLGDFDRFPQSSNWLNGSSRGWFSLGRKQDEEQRGTDSPQGVLSWICHGIVTALVFLLTLLTFPFSGWFVLKIVPMYERIIVFRLGRIRSPQGPGMVLLLPFIDHWQQVDLRTRAFSIPPCKLEVNDTTKSWGLEVDRVELMLEAVPQQMPPGSNRGPQSSMPPVPGLEGLESTIQQLALHFFGKTLAASATNPNGAFETAEHVKIQNEVDQSAPTTDAVMSSSEKKKLNVEELFLAMEVFLSESLVNQVRASYQINVLLSSGVQSTYFLDLSTGKSVCSVKIILFIDLPFLLSIGHGRIGQGLPDHSPDVVLEMAESDLEAFILGELHPLSAYVCGRLRVQGDLNVALKLEELFKVMKQRR
ncbi:hypothetical protein lerEdw1_008364 [Lerista edwardsae]|nr:hypothetical protein lerEdw1_008364 [Lerista edwardsae]